MNDAFTAISRPQVAQSGPSFLNNGSDIRWQPTTPLANRSRGFAVASFGACQPHPQVKIRPGTPPETRTPGDP